MGPWNNHERPSSRKLTHLSFCRTGNLDAVSISSRMPQSAPGHAGLSSKVQKLESYSDSMAAHALFKERTGQLKEAASYYLKAADILLVVCNDQNLDYPTWARLSTKASAHHNRVKMLLASHHNAPDRIQQQAL